MKEIIVCATGDVGPNRPDPASIFRNVTQHILKADVAFCQLETNFSTRGVALPQARLPMRAHPQNAKAIKEAGFQVVSFASNHCMDWGREAFFDTLDVLEREGLSVVGAGADIERARRPVVRECGGHKIAFLAYNSVLPHGYWAEETRPGCVPLRAWTIYEQIEHDQPGTPSRIHTFPHKEDAARMIADIARAKAEADTVIVSMHWGIHFIPAEIADYERELGHAAIDAGADLIVGHHPHILKGIEVYKGRVIFHSLSNFALELPFAFAQGDLWETRQHKEIMNLNPNWGKDRDYPMPPDTMKSMVVKCVISEKGIKRVSFLPVYLSKIGEPEILTAKDPRFTEVVKYVEEIGRVAGVESSFKVKGDEVLVGAS
ncbi:MAG TPA: CapA family protein [Syntrophorhabdaceae bacterium]|nr:CapA family protein [Syntrophorhabdaceae bacterium]